MDTRQHGTCQFCARHLKLNKYGALPTHSRISLKNELGVICDGGGYEPIEVTTSQAEIHMKYLGHRLDSIMDRIVAINSDFWSATTFIQFSQDHLLGEQEILKDEIGFYYLYDGKRFEVPDFYVPDADTPLDAAICLRELYTLSLAKTASTISHSIAKLGGMIAKSKARKKTLEKAGAKNEAV